MANDAAKKAAKAYAFWSKIIAAITAIITFLFVYFGIYGNDNFGMWSWIAYILIIITYWFSIRQVLNSIAGGLPKPEMFYDAMYTAFFVNLLMIWSPYFFWLLLWVPAYYGYKAYGFMSNMAGMAGMGQQDQGYGNQQQGGGRKRKKKRRRG
eukprot:CAMPEP_0201581070 /NCGR_PEP_ID=MMETSP0190_2-20130828/62304_1 /ASSEMBLY_ACC=CAM_ASM_000263 /TAXON_ID=37353 /ORGANISM="Rosalina sp." /LENGTH=151 /DNA_ID=CAMNT_0048018317 /DNA_START=15 /DNA_END=470 /DNA_ORIENTATION=+